MLSNSISCGGVGDGAVGWDGGGGVGDDTNGEDGSYTTVGDNSLAFFSTGSSGTERSERAR